jgi:hypothetical protein
MYSHIRVTIGLQTPFAKAPAQSKQVELAAETRLHQFLTAECSHDYKICSLCHLHNIRNLPQAVSSKYCSSKVDNKAQTKNPICKKSYPFQTKLNNTSVYCLNSKVHPDDMVVKGEKEPSK